MNVARFIVNVAIVSLCFTAIGLSQAHWSQWSDWQTTSNYEGIDFRTRTKQESWQKNGEYILEMEVRNRYHKKITVTADLKDPQKYNGGWTSFGRFSVKAGSTYLVPSNKFPQGEFESLQIRFMRLEYEN